jgi:nicotinamidase/pyrazinamidase
VPQVLWPDHCVQNTHGAALARELDQRRITINFRKGVNRDVDSYSDFFDNSRRVSTGLEEWLRRAGVDEVFVCGLATDYCVKATSLDAARLGFKTHLVLPGCRAVNLNPGDADAAIREMQAAGVELITDLGDPRLPAA